MTNSGNITEAQHGVTLGTGVRVGSTVELAITTGVEVGVGVVSILSTPSGDT